MAHLHVKADDVPGTSNQPSVNLEETDEQIISGSPRQYEDTEDIEDLSNAVVDCFVPVASQDTGTVTIEPEGGNQSINQSEEIRFNCLLCGKTFLYPKKLLRHARLRHYRNQAIVTCAFCGRTFTNADDLEIHSRIHTFVKPPSFSCALCGKSFWLRNLLDAHMRIHTGEKPFTCSVCGKTFGYPQHLHKHTLAKHRSRDRPRCSDCGILFDSADSLEFHSRMHSEEELLDATDPSSDPLCGY